MRRIIEDDKKRSVFDNLLGETVTLYCINYIYTGKLTGVNDAYVELTNPKIVYETGAYSNATWKDAQQLPKNVWFVMKDAIESFGIMK